MGKLLSTSSLKKILVVEDDPTCRLLFCRVLKHAGYEPCEAEHAQHALETYAAGLGPEGDISLVVTDVRMQGIDGFQMACLVWNARPELPVIFFTGDITDARLQDKSVLEKPSDLKRPVPLVKQLLTLFLFLP